ncbi:MAG: response regulator [Methanolinea sp.]|nr:response regulator [Methanolinea sp.]
MVGGRIRMAPIILVVDDNPGIISILRAILEMEGYIVHAAGSGEECLALVSREKPDLVLLDIVMPRMDGWTVLERIRSDRENDPVRVLMVTAKPPTREEAERYAPLIDGYVMKPFDLRALKKTVADLLAEKEKMRTVRERVAGKAGWRQFLEEYCRLSRIVRAQEAFSALLERKGKGEDRPPTPEAVRLERLKEIIRRASEVSDAGG